MKKLIRIILLILILFLSITASFAQTTGDYRSVGSGNWTTPGTWELYNGASWIPATTYPGQNEGTGDVNIQLGNTVSITITNPTPFAIGSLTVSGMLSLILDIDVSIITQLFVVTPGFGNINFVSNKATLTLSINATLIITTGGITSEQSHNNWIKVGETYYASGSPTLKDLTDQGGYNLINVSISPATVVFGSGAFTLSATAVPPTNTTFNWYNVPSGGGTIHTGSPYNTGTISATTTYYVEVLYTGSPTYTTSRKAVVATVNIPLTVGAVTPATQTVCAGSPASFSVTPTGTAPFAYQWRKNMVDIPGANLATYTIPYVTLADATTLANETTWYDVVVTNICGIKYPTNNAQLIVNSVPTATINGTTSVCQNSTAPNITFTNPQTLPVTVTYNVNGANQTTINVGTATAATLPAPTTTTGIFTYNLVSVAYQTAPTCSNIITGTATVTVNSLPTIVTQPINQLDCEGHIVSFNVVATGAGLSYTWQRKKPSEGSFTDIPSETNVSYPTPGTIRLQNVGNSDAPSGTQYRVLVFNSNCSVTSNAAKLTVNEITDVIPSVSNPLKTDVIICTGDNFNYQVTTSYPLNVVSYQWKRKIDPGPWTDLSNVGVIFGATSSQLILTGATPSESGEYKVTVEFYKTGSTTCLVTSDSRKRKLTMNPLATVTPGGPDNICQSVTPSAITLSGASIGGGASTGAWSITNLSPANGGLNGTLSTTAQTALPGTVIYTPPANYAGIITLTLTTDDPAGPCGVESATRTITINPLPPATLIYHD